MSGGFSSYQSGAAPRSSSYQPPVTPGVAQYSSGAQQYFDARKFATKPASPTPNTSAPSSSVADAFAAGSAGPASKPKRKPRAKEANAPSGSTPPTANSSSLIDLNEPAAAADSDPFASFLSGASSNAPGKDPALALIMTHFSSASLSRESALPFFYVVGLFFCTEFILFFDCLNSIRC